MTIKKICVHCAIHFTLNNLHFLQGTVYIKDESTLHIRDFSFTSEGPEAFFYVGDHGLPNKKGTQISESPLRKYDSEDVEIHLPLGYGASQLKWLSVWCPRYWANFGDVVFETEEVEAVDRGGSKNLSQPSQVASWIMMIGFGCIAVFFLNT